MTETFQSTFTDIFNEAFDLLVARQKKYGPENIRQLGLFGVFGRLADDKIERIRRGMNGTIDHGVVTIETQDFNDESFEDALMDIANYALIMIALKRGIWGHPLEEEKPEPIETPLFASWNEYGHINVSELKEQMAKFKKEYE